MSGIAKRDKNQSANEVIEILRGSHPLTVEMIERISDPPLSRNAIKHVLKRLKRRGLLDCLVAGPSTCYYQLTDENDQKLRRESAQGSPLLRRQNWFHNQWCEFWISEIKKAIPGCVVIREHSLGAHEIAKSILQHKNDLSDVMPDFLVIFPSHDERRRVSIAFEIERTRKSDERILRKLKRYMNQTFLDGLIYVCDSVRLAETIRGLYIERLKSRSPRIGHYAENFFLFSDCMSPSSNPFERLFNTNLQRVPLTKWSNQLRSVERNRRSNEIFA